MEGRKKTKETWMKKNIKSGERIVFANQRIKYSRDKLSWDNMEKRACFRTSYLVLKLKAIPLRDILRDITETIKTNVDVLINRRIESFPKPKYIILHVKTISIFSNSRHSRQSRTTYVSIEEIYAEKNRISLLASYISRVFSHTRSKRVYIHLFLLHTL